jgi:hypothetical protein
MRLVNGPATPEATLTLWTHLMTWRYGHTVHSSVKTLFSDEDSESVHSTLAHKAIWSSDINDQSSHALRMVANASAAYETVDYCKRRITQTPCLRTQLSLCQKFGYPLPAAQPPEPDPLPEHPGLFAEVRKLTVMLRTPESDVCMKFSTCSCNCVHEMHGCTG